MGALFWLAFLGLSLVVQALDPGADTLEFEPYQEDRREILFGSPGTT